MKIEVTHCETVGEVSKSTTVSVDMQILAPSDGLTPEEVRHFVEVLKNSAVTGEQPATPRNAEVSVFVDGVKQSAKVNVERTIVPHALLNDLAGLSTLPGSPRIVDALKQIMEELPNLRHDARLGRMIRNMPYEMGLLHGPDGFWYSMPDSHVPTSGPEKAPEDALRAGGVTL